MKKQLIPFLAAAAISLGGVAGMGIASAAGPDGSGATNMLAKVAVKLGITQDKLTQAFKDARIELIDEAVASGKMTADQATKAKERVNTGDAMGGPGMGGPGMGGRGMGDHRGGPGRGLDQVAAAIGITTDELRTQLEAGKTPVQVAQSKGIDEATLKTKVLAAIKADLDAKVKAGTITQAQADTMYTEAQEHISDMLNHTPPARPQQGQQGQTGQQGQGQGRGPRGGAANSQQGASTSGATQGQAFRNGY